MKTTQYFERHWLRANGSARIPESLRGWERNWTIQVAVILLVTLGAAGLRLYRLGEWSFWGDELITLGRSELFFELGPQHWSVTRFLNFVSLTIFGRSEWAARLAPSIIGIVTIPILFFQIRQIWGGMVAMLVACLLAVSTWHLYWSQNARFYTALLLFCTIALLMLYRGLEEDRPWLIIGSLLAFGLAAQERLIALLLVPVVGAYVLAIYILGFEKPLGLNVRNLIILIVPGLFLSIAIPLLYPNVRDPSLWLVTFGRINTNPIWILSGVAYYVGVPTIGIAAAGAYSYLKKRERAALLLTLGAVVPLLSIMAASLFQYAANRYVFISLPYWIILASLALGRLLAKSSGSTRVLALGTLLVLAITPLSENFLYFRYQNGNRDNWKAAFQYVEQNSRPGDLVVSANAAAAAYYLDIDGMKLNTESILRVARGDQRAWIVEDMNVEELYPSELDWIEDNARLAANFDVHLRARNFKMRVYLYDPLPGLSP